MKVILSLLLLAGIFNSAHAETAEERAHLFCSDRSMKEKVNGCGLEARIALAKKLKTRPSQLRFYQNVSVGDGAAATEILLFKSPETGGPLWKVELNGEDCMINNIEPLG